MPKKCIGCGAILQIEEPSKEGYVETLKDCYCRRCFRIKNYGQYEVIEKQEKDFLPIFQEIKQSNGLLLYMLDLFHMEHDFLKTIKQFPNPCILVLSKRDILPKKVSDEKLISYFKDARPYVKAIHIISSYKNTGFDALYQDILKNKVGDTVYLIGNTNAGKSTFLNRMVNNYGAKEGKITTSILPNTTLSILEVPLHDNLTIKDTPGLLVPNSMLLKLEPKMIKKVIPKKEIRPITYQIKDTNSFLIENLARIDTDSIKNSITFYLSNELKFTRIKPSDSNLKDLKKHILHVNDQEDVVIEGLGFLKIVHACKIVVYTSEDVLVYTRKNLI